MYPRAFWSSLFSIHEFTIVKSVKWKKNWIGQIRWALTIRSGFGTLINKEVK
jgi:hypothetical protein